MFPLWCKFLFLMSLLRDQMQDSAGRCCLALLLTNRFRSNAPLFYLTDTIFLQVFVRTIDRASSGLCLQVDEQARLTFYGTKVIPYWEELSTMPGAGCTGQSPLPTESISISRPAASPRTAECRRSCSRALPAACQCEPGPGKLHPCHRRGGRAPAPHVAAETCQ